VKHEVDLPNWAVARGSGLNLFDAIDPARTALVVIDMQRVFLCAQEVFGNPYALGVIPAVNRLAAAMRNAGGRVIWTRQTVSAAPPRAMPAWQYDLSDPRVARAVEAMTTGAHGHELHPAMAVGPDDIVIDKYRYSAFLCPDRALEQTLTEHGIEMLVIAGTLTNVCCESTARDGNMMGHKVILVSDATAAVSDAEHNAALLNLRLTFADVRSTDAVCAMLGAR
jgi:nicotinamidase-related amidase